MGLKFEAERCSSPIGTGVQKSVEADERALVPKPIQSLKEFRKLAPSFWQQLFAGSEEVWKRGCSSQLA